MWKKFIMKWSKKNLFGKELTVIIEEQGQHTPNAECLSKFSSGFDTFLLTLQAHQFYKIRL